MLLKFIIIYITHFRCSKFKYFIKHHYLPTMVIIHATTYDKLPIQMIHMMKVRGNHFLKRGCSQSGIVTKNTV